MRTQLSFKILMCCLFLVIATGCKNDDGSPDPIFSATIQSSSTGEQWTATDGGLVVFQDGNVGGIRMRLTRLCKPQSHDLSLVISSPMLDPVDLKPFEFINLGEDRKGFGGYKTNDLTKVWQPNNQFSVEVNITEVKDVNSKYFVSGSFSFFGCNPDLTPVCIGQSGVFENLAVQYGSEYSEILLSCERARVLERGCLKRPLSTPTGSLFKTALKPDRDFHQAENELINSF